MGHFRKQYKSNRLVVFALISILCIVAAGCRDCNGIESKESFMLVYVDTNEHIRVRYSDDGLSWSLGNLEGATDDAGVGATASLDGVGMTRVIAHTGGVSRLRLRWGVGPANWDASDRDVDDVQRVAASITYADSNLLLVTGLGQTNGVSVYSYESTSRQVVDRTPTGLSGLVNQYARHIQIFNHDGLLLVGFLRYSGYGSQGSPVGVELIVGTSTHSAPVNWTQAIQFTNTEPGYSGVVSGPCFSHDTAKVYMGVVRQSTASSTYKLFIYSSTDGITWQLHDSMDQIPFVDEVQVRIAVQSSKKVVAGFMGGQGTHAVYRKNTDGSWTRIPDGSLFGSDTPSFVPFALISAGRPPTATN